MEAIWILSFSCSSALSIFGPRNVVTANVIACGTLLLTEADTDISITGFSPSGVPGRLLSPSVGGERQRVDGELTLALVGSANAEGCEGH